MKTTTKKQVQEINEELQRHEGNIEAMEKLEGKRVNRKVEPRNAYSKDGFVEEFADESDKPALVTTKDKLMNVYSQVSLSRRFRQNAENLKAEFPAFMSLLKNNPDKNIGNAVFRFCKKHYITCKMGFGFLFVKHLMEMHDEKAIITKWDDEYLSSLKRENLKVMEINFEEDKGSAASPFGEFLPNSKD